jgi:hypothetical protein
VRCAFLVLMLLHKLARTDFRFVISMSSSSVSVVAEVDQVKELGAFLAGLRASDDAASSDSPLVKEYLSLANSNKYSDLVEKAIGDIELAANKAGDRGASSSLCRINPAFGMKEPRRRSSSL